MSELPIYTFSNSSVRPMDRNEFDDIHADPRGIVWMWEPPSSSATYVMGIDPTMGITGWNRHVRTLDDYKTDNAAIEIVKVGYGDPGQPDFVPDVQVCEYAAPIDAEELADVANSLGRLYGGAQEEGQAHCIIETFPGPGMITLLRMRERHGYTNQFLYRPQETLTHKPTTWGWSANQRSVRDLWIKSRNHILKKGLTHHSPWLVEEWTDCEMDYVKQTAAAENAHDDRVRAINLALWAAHHWSFAVESVTDKPVATDEPEWQASDISAEDLAQAWEDRFDSLQQ